MSKPIISTGEASPPARGWNVDRLGAFLEGYEMPANLFADLMVPSRFFEGPQNGSRAAAEAVVAVRDARCTVRPRPPESRFEGQVGWFYGPFGPGRR